MSDGSDHERGFDGDGRGPDDVGDAGHGDDGDDPRVREGLDHLQRAAREVIAASRALLDVAEELVEDPRTAAGVVDLFGSFASRARAAGEAAGRAAGRAATAGRSAVDRHDVDGDGEPSDGPDDDPPVQRIPVF